MEFSKQKKQFILGFSIGLALGIIMRELSPDMKAMLKPMAKNLIRSTFTFVEKCREKISVFGEAVEDITAEVNYELKNKKEASTNSKAAKKRRKEGPSKAAQASSQGTINYDA
jgi:hypothetical protein